MQAHYPEFIARFGAQDRSLPKYAPGDFGEAAIDLAAGQRVFNIDVTTCVNCGGAARIVASVEDPTAIRAILAHFDKHGVLEQAH